MTSSLDSDGPSSDPVTQKSRVIRTTAMRDTVLTVHRACMHRDFTIRDAAVKSLEEIAGFSPLTVLQTWLDQFARTNGGGSPAEYSARERIYLLQSLERIIAKMRWGDVETEEDFNIAGKACVGRVIALATEEMTKHSDVVPDVQKPCSGILVELGSAHLDRVMDAVLLKLNPGGLPHFFTISTLGSLAQSHSLDMVPYLKNVLGIMTGGMKIIRKDNLKFAYASAFSNFAEAIQEYLSNLEAAPDPTITAEEFCSELDTAHDVMFSQWLSSRDVKVRHSVLGALGRMAGLLSNDRLQKSVCPIIMMLIAGYKRSGGAGTTEPYYITSCVVQLIDAVSKTEPATLEPVAEPLLTSLFTQACCHASWSSTLDYASKPLSVKNHHEVLRCYDVLVQHHRDKLVSGLVIRLGSLDENIRLGALTVIKHIITTSFECVEKKMPEIFSAVHSKLNEQSAKVCKMLAQVTALLGRKGLLQGKEGSDFLKFIVRLCARPEDADNGSIGENDSSLREMCCSILLLLAKSVPEMESVLWPHLVDYLLAPDFSLAVAPVVRALDEIATRKESEEIDTRVSFGEFAHAEGPYAVFARLIVLAALPFPDSRGGYILSFLRRFAPSVNKHLSAVWGQRIPLLQHYLWTHVSASTGAKSWDQDQWEQWLLGLLDDTVKEISLEEWNSAMATSMQQQMDLYSDDLAGEKSFLIRCLGVVIKNSGSRSLVLTHLTTIYQPAMQNFDKYAVAAADSFGSSAVTHLDVVIEKLETLLRLEFQKKSSTFFGLIKDSKVSEEQMTMRTVVLLCAGQAALHARGDQLAAKADDITSKFVAPALKCVDTKLKVSALRAMANVARAVHKADKEVTLSHYSDLMHEAISCLTQDSWDLADKRVALDALVELVRCPPTVSQMMRCELLKACFTAAFPSLVMRYYSKDESYTTASTREAELKAAADALLLLVEELLRQDLQQSTLDEIFTLLESWLRRDYCLTREMAVRVLQRSLAVFYNHIHSNRPLSCFSPGPYIVGSLVPRCFDDSRAVQAAALACMQSVLRLLAVFEGLSEESADEATRSLTALLILSPTHSEKDERPISSATVGRAVADVLHKRIQHTQLLPLLESLVDSVLDVIPRSARGASAVLATLVEKRGNEVYAHAADLTKKLLYQLAQLDGCDETRVRVLSCVRGLASFNRREVTAFLLSRPFVEITEDDSEALTSVWRVLTHEPAVATEVMHQLVQAASKDIFEERVDRRSDKLVRCAILEPLSAVTALKTMLEMKEMDIVCEDEFAAVFVPLLSALNSYAGVQHPKAQEKKKHARGQKSSTSIFNRGSDQDAADAADKSHVIGSDSPFTVAKGALKAFLKTKGCPGPAAMVENSIDENADDLARSLSSFNTSLFEGLMRDFPEFLSKLAPALQPLLDSQVAGRRRVAICFFSQILCTEAPGISLSMRQAALTNLLSSLRWEREVLEERKAKVDAEDDVRGVMSEQWHKESDEMRVLCLRGISYFRAQQHEYINSDSDSAASPAAMVLSALLEAVGQDFKSDVNRAALCGLTAVLQADRGLAGCEVHRVLSDMASRVRPFFDGGSPAEAAAAIRCFCALAAFADVPDGSDDCSYRDVYADHLDGALVSLLLHASDENKDVRTACRDGLNRTLADKGGRETSANVITASHHDERDVDYEKTTDAMLDIDTSMKTKLPAWTVTTVAYFRSGQSRLRVSAVNLLSALISRMSKDSLREVDSGVVCQGLATLLTNDKTRTVQEVAAAVIGKVFVRLGRVDKMK